MEAILYSWLSAATVAPFVAILSVWTLIVFWSYRHRWRLVDLFLFSVAVHEMFSAMFGFGFAVLSLIRPLLHVPCCSIVWGLTATRIFHISIVTSLILERAIVVRKSYTFRASMRKNHVRYHIGVLATIAVTVGMTSVFARVSSKFNGFCSLHPLAWNVQFSVFTVTVYGILLFTGLVGFILVQMSQVDDQEIKELPSLSWDSGRSTSTSNSSRQLKTEWNDSQNLEWRTVACICWLSYITNHGPFLAMTVMGLAVPTFWSPWLDNVAIWLRLTQGCLVPLVLVIFDLPHRSALRNMLRRRGRIYKHLTAQRNGLRLKLDDFCYTKERVLPPLHVFPDNGGRLLLPLFQNPMRRRWTPDNLSSLHMLHPDRRLCRILDFSSFEKPTFAKWNVPFPEPPAYDTLGSCCSLSLPSNEGKVFSGSADDIGSITTDAFDDFDFLAGSYRCIVGYEERSVLCNTRRNAVYPHLCTIFPKLFETKAEGTNLGKGKIADSSATGYAEWMNELNDCLSSPMNLTACSDLPERLRSETGEQKTYNIATSDANNCRLIGPEGQHSLCLEDGTFLSCIYHGDVDAHKRCFCQQPPSKNAVQQALPGLLSDKETQPCSNVHSVSGSSNMSGIGISNSCPLEDNSNSVNRSFLDSEGYLHAANEMHSQQHILYSEYL